MRRLPLAVFMLTAFTLLILPAEVLAKKKPKTKTIQVVCDTLASEQVTILSLLGLILVVFALVALFGLVVNTPEDPSIKWVLGLVVFFFPVAACLIWLLTEWPNLVPLAGVSLFMLGAACIAVLGVGEWGLWTRLALSLLIPVGLVGGTVLVMSVGFEASWI